MPVQKRNDLEFYDLAAQEWWDETAKIYALNHLNQARFDYFDEYIPHWQELKVLDIGCGGGFSCEWMAKRGAIVSGIDRSQSCIAAAKEHAASEGLTINYRSGLAENLPDSDNTYDAVICVDVLEHVADWQKTISEIYRVLKPGGFFGFDTINRTFKSKLIMIWLMENVLREISQGVHDWQKFIKPEELTRSMQQTGFDGIEIYGFDLFGTGEKLANKLAAYRHYKKTGSPKISINQDTSVMYIGKAQKPAPPLD